MKTVIVWLIALVIIGSAGWILGRRIRDFVRTKGQSACDSCPYSGHCNKKCDK